MPVLPIEDEVNPRILDNHDVAVSDIEKDDHSKPTKKIFLEEMIADQNDANNVPISSVYRHAYLEKDGTLVRCSLLDGAVQTVAPHELRERVIELSQEPLL